DWYIAGHSLGGAMACSFVKNSAEDIAGLILLASYPAQGDDLSSNDLDVLSIYASNDGLATVQKIDSTKRLLPPQTVYYCIQGGNHTQFGWYLTQDGDGQADISRQQQQDELLSSILKFIRMKQ
ncbi:MAG TPA: alpha/beta hydrolase, partial [Petrotogaceae bacterium]|nr:alpha/beta hydrolase [Petrotogaceae bacterium]